MSLILNASITGSQQFTGSVAISGSFTASLSNGYAWVGNSSNMSTQVATSSFAGGTISVQDEGTILGNSTSFNFNGAGVTATLSAGTASITIAGGGGSIDTGSFATTGSNVFNPGGVGNQIFDGGFNTMRINENPVVFNLGTVGSPTEIGRIEGAAGTWNSGSQYDLTISPAYNNNRNLVFNKASGTGKVITNNIAMGGVVQTITPDGSAVAAIDWSTGNYWNLITNDSVARIDFSNVTVGQTITIAITGNWGQPGATTIDWTTYESGIIYQTSGSAYTTVPYGQTDILTLVAMAPTKIYVIPTLNMVP